MPAAGTAQDARDISSRVASSPKNEAMKSARKKSTQRHMTPIDDAISTAHGQAARTGTSVRAIDATVATHAANAVSGTSRGPANMFSEPTTRSAAANTM